MTGLTKALPVDGYFNKRKEMETRQRNRPWVHRERHAAGWIMGQDVHSSQDYIIHTQAPAFIAKIAHDSNEGILSGLSYATNAGRSIYDFVWFDAVPNKRAFFQLMRDAEAALNAYLEFTGPRDDLR